MSSDVALGEAFAEWARVLATGAPALVMFFAAGTADEHGTPFDHKVTTAYALFPETVVNEMRAARFDDFEIVVSPPPEGGRPFELASVMGRRRPG